MRKANNFTWNVSVKVRTVVKLGLYESPLFSLIMYDFTCVTLTRKKKVTLKRFQKKVVKSITDKKRLRIQNTASALKLLAPPNFF